MKELSTSAACSLPRTAPGFLQSMLLLLLTAATPVPGLAAGSIAGPDESSGPLFPLDAQSAADYALPPDALPPDALPPDALPPEGTYGRLVMDLAGRWDRSLPRGQVLRLQRPVGGSADAGAGEARLVRWIEAAGDACRAAGADEALRMLVSLGRWRAIEPQFGFRPWSADDADVAAALARGGGRAVVLIHGLDDPGWMWDDLAPALEDAGHVVLEFRYPNDGPVVESADLFALTLAQLPSAIDAETPVRLDIVAHSMGGLVARDLLTRPLLDGARGTLYPAIDRFIMCGTPNHGSALAPMRAVTELRERAVRAARGEDPGAASVKEGSGLAAIDLAPGSPLLRELAARPLPQEIAITIIAARLVADPEAAIRDSTGKAGRALTEGGAPRWTVNLVDRFGRTLRRAASEAIAAVGDGMVSVESARLEGVEDFTLIEANHASMLISRFGGPVPPPAIPIILDRLSREP